MKLKEINKKSLPVILYNICWFIVVGGATNVATTNKSVDKNGNNVEENIKNATNVANTILSKEPKETTNIKR